MRSAEKALLSAALAVLVAATLISCATTDATPPPGPDPSRSADIPSRYEDWVPLRLVQALESEPYRPIAELGQTADVVAIGRFTEVLEVRRVGHPVGLAPVLPVLFEPTLVLRGTVDGPLPVEFPLVGRSVEDAVAAYRNALLGPEVLLILRAKRFLGEEGRYRIVNTYGLWVATDRHALDAPLAEVDPWEDERYAATLAEAQGSLTALAAIAVSLPQLPPPTLPVPSPTTETVPADATP